MNKKNKKYISGSMIAVLVLVSMPLQTVANVNSDNGGNVADVEQEASSNNNGDVENILDGADDDDKIIVDDTLENNAAIEKDFLQDRDVEGPDSEDIIEEFTDPNFRSII